MNTHSKQFDQFKDLILSFYESHLDSKKYEQNEKLENLVKTLIDSRNQENCARILKLPYLKIQDRDQTNLSGIAFQCRW